MPNDPKAAAEKRAPQAVQRENGQSDHEGSAHDPEEFRVMNPARQADAPEAPNVRGVQAEHYFGSQAWEATSPAEQAAEGAPTAPVLTPDPLRVSPEERRNHAVAQGTDAPANSGAPNLREDQAEPGQIDKANDC